MNPNIFRSLPELYLILDKDLYIVDSTDIYNKVTLTVRGALIGKYVFEAFPGEPGSNSVPPLLASFNQVKKYKKPHFMEAHEYSIEDPDTGEMVTRYWQIKNYPVLDSKGKVAFIINKVQDVTEDVINLNGLKALRDELRDIQPRSSR